MRIVPVPCLKDNYAYLVICEQTGLAAVVDPSEADPVLAAAAREGVTLTAVWNTHHHWDHTGGNERLVEAHPELAVVAHASDKGRVPGQTVFAEEGDEVSVGKEATARVIHNPGHTTGAVSFYLASAPAVFTGDTLFCAGCGRLFEGTPADMHASLAKLAALPAETRVFCGHEYTAANLVFAAAVEPDNTAVAERTKKVVSARAAGEPSVPSTIAEEKATNPFMRSQVEAVARAARAHEPDATTPSEVLGAIRRWKDRF